MDPIPLRAVRVRTVRREEEASWNALMRAQHDLGFRQLCGQRLRQVAVLSEQWLALLGWQSAAWHCAARERWIDWTQRQRQPAAPLLLAETFVDPLRFAGTCYRAANWLEIGQTQGYRRVQGAPRGYQAHGLPKRVFVYPLHRQARTQLAASQPQPSWQARCPRILLTPVQWHDLYAYLDQVPDTRHRQGRRYSMRTVLTILIAARLAGCQSLTEWSDFGRALDPSTLQAIRSYRCARTGRYKAPGISGWHSILRTIPVGQVERLLAAWTAAQVLPPPAAKAAGKGAAEPSLAAVAIDGQVLRGS